jgi:ribosomal protein S9
MGSRESAAVQVTLLPGGKGRVVVNGHDISANVAPGGVRIEAAPRNGLPRVYLELLSPEVTVDLPEGATVLDAAGG